MSYSVITLNANQICDFLSATKNSLNINNATLTYEPSWTNDTDFLCTFDDNSLIASNGTGIATPDKVTIYKKKTGDAFIRKVGTVGYGVTSFVDQNTADESEYYYQIYFEGADISATTAYKTDSVTTDWSKYVLLSGEVQTVSIKDSNGIEIATENEFIVDKTFLFELDATIDSLNANISTQTQSNFTRYPKIHKGKQNYYNGVLSGLVGYEDSHGDYYDDLKMMEAIRLAVTDGKRKFLKDLRGHVWEVELTSFTVASRSNYIQNPYDVQIGFSEIASADNLIIRGE